MMLHHKGSLGLAQDGHTVQGDDEHRAHVAENREPEPGVAAEGERDHHHLAPDGEDDVLPNPTIPAHSDIHSSRPIHTM